MGQSLASSGVGRAAVALAIAVAVHAGVLILLEWGRGLASDQPWQPHSDDLSAAVQLTESAPAQITTIALIREVPAGAWLPAIIVGAGDQVGVGDQHPFPNAGADFPGWRPAARGGGESGGAERFAEERFARDASAEVWNDDRRYRSPRRASGRVGGDQPLRQTPAPGFDPRARRPRRADHAGVDHGHGTTSDPGSSGIELVIPAAPGASPTVVLSGPEPEVEPKPEVGPEPEVAGEAGTGSESAADRRTEWSRPAAADARLLAREGPPTATGAGRGADGARHEVAAASDALDPLPIELVSPRTGALADGHGVAGESHASGLIANGWTRRGTAATSARIARGNRRVTIEARRENPYFRRMYHRVDQVVVFPRELAIAMEQGEVVARFTLFANGSIGDLVIAKPSGFEDFDRELVRALLAVAPFGVVPKAVLQGRDRVTVVTPYTFRNRLIR